MKGLMKRFHLSYQRPSSDSPLTNGTCSKSGVFGVEVSSWRRPSLYQGEIRFLPQRRRPNPCRIRRSMSQHVAARHAWCRWRPGASICDVGAAWCCIRSTNNILHRYLTLRSWCWMSHVSPCHVGPVVPVSPCLGNRGLGIHLHARERRRERAEWHSRF
jgi:hypothetical protein